nr:hypothetical protein [Candidatus Njordarchaeum guaymaensis]
MADIPYLPEIVASVPWLLIVVGVLAFIYAIVRWKTPKETSGPEVALGVIGFIIGLVLPIVAAICFLNGAWGIFTLFLLILLSEALVLGPIARIMKKVPALATAAIGASGVAYIVAVLVVGLIPSWLVPYIGGTMWIMIGIFIVIAIFSFMIILFARGIIEFTGLVLGAWPIMIILGVICIAQGVLLLAHMSLLQFIEGAVALPPWLT